MQSLTLIDPHAFLASFGCLDGTSNFNNIFATEVTSEDPPDGGLLGRSLTLVFRSFAQTAGTQPVEIYPDADCTAPLATTTCRANPQVFATTATVPSGGTCLAAIAGTTSNTGTNSPTAPCFNTAGISFPMPVPAMPGATVALSDFRVGATFVSNPATGLTTGLLRGFLSKADADVTVLPSPISTPLSQVLRGGGSSCTGDDRDTGPGGVSGWYIYYNFTATRVPWSD